MGVESETLEAVIVLVWLCLSTAPWKAPLFRTYLSCKEAVADLSARAKLFFCPGLLEVLQAVTPPSIHFFLDLPSALSKGKCWGIYALVLTKAGWKPYVYIGSATAVGGGLRTRMKSYDYKDQKNIPKYVWTALNEGYTIEHQGVLVWHPEPCAALVPITRLLLVAIEAALSFALWTMRSQTKDYRMAGCCLWSRESITYGGLCSHSALAEHVGSNFDLSHEQLEELAAQKKARTAERMREYIDSGAFKKSMKKYCDSDHGRLKRSTYAASAAGRAAYKRHYDSKGKDTLKAYRKTTAGKETIKRWNSSKKCKAVNSRYAKSEKGRAAAKRAYEKDKSKDWICATCHRNFAAKVCLQRHLKAFVDHVPADTKSSVPTESGST